MICQITWIIDLNNIIYNFWIFFHKFVIDDIRLYKFYVTKFVIILPFDYCNIANKKFFYKKYQLCDLRWKINFQTTPDLDYLHSLPFLLKITWTTPESLGVTRKVSKGGSNMNIVLLTEWNPKLGKLWGFHERVVSDWRTTIIWYVTS